MHLLRVLVLLMFAFFLSNCASSQLKNATSGATGCLPDEVEIIRGNPQHWLAKCEGKLYVCSGMGGSVNCTERKPRQRN